MAVIKRHSHRQLVTGNEFNLLTDPRHSPSPKEVRADGGNLAAEADAEAMEVYCSLVCSACFLTASRATSSEVAPPIVTGPSPINYQPRKHTAGLHTGSSGGNIISAEVPASQLTGACVKLT